MMDTILNLGINDEVEDGLAQLCGDAGFARNTHVRFIREFGHMVLGGDIDRLPDEASPADLRASIVEDTGTAFPADPNEQLEAAIRAVFDSWVSRRAIAYRKHWGIPEDGGTAVVVQTMVFGNLGSGSGTGVLFTRDPVTGAPEMYGEWLPGGQGDDVVGGSVDPLPLAAMAEQLPEAHMQLLDAAHLLERESRDVQDIEFTVEAGRLYLLQARTAKRSAQAALRTAVELASEGAIDRLDGPEPGHTRAGHHRAGAAALGGGAGARRGPRARRSPPAPASPPVSSCATRTWPRPRRWT